MIGIVIGVSIVLSVTNPRPPSTIQVYIKNESGMPVSNYVARVTQT